MYVGAQSMVCISTYTVTDLYVLSKLVCRLRALSVRTSLSAYTQTSGEYMCTCVKGVPFRMTCVTERERERERERVCVLYLHCTQLLFLLFCNTVQLCQRL